MAGPGRPCGGTLPLHPGPGLMPPSSRSLPPPPTPCGHSFPALPSGGILPSAPLPGYPTQVLPHAESIATTVPSSERVLPTGHGPGTLPYATSHAHSVHEDRRAPPPAPKPPAWQQFEQRLHLLEVVLDELELHPDAPDLAPAWYESLNYFVSLHPRSEPHQEIPMPRDAPKATVAGKYLVSKIQPPKAPQVKVPPKASRRPGGGGEEDGEVKTDPTANPVVQYNKEELALTMDHLDHHLVAYIWGKKSHVAKEEVTLVGRALAPLHEFKFQRKSTTWGVFDVLEGHRVAEMRLRYSVCTTPSSVLQPYLAEVKQTEVTIKWSPPANDHGAPVIGYKVAILLDAKKGDEGPQWFTLCERTKTTNPVYVVANLIGNTAYMVDIRAVNKVGVGDPCEFQITTAPVEPDPPSKPWIQEARDGCLNVAWRPPESDGGFPVTAYKVKMRKILGASKWNPFGPGESSATWVDMGTVGAAMNDQAEPSSPQRANTASR